MYARQIDKNGMCKNHVVSKQVYVQKCIDKYACLYVQKWHKIDMNMQFPRQLEEIFVCLRIKLRSGSCQIKE